MTQVTQFPLPIVFAVFVLLAGAARATEHPISTAPEYQAFADVAFNPGAREFLVVWSSSASDVYGARVVDGAVQGNDLLISTGGIQVMYSVVAAKSGQWLAVWRDALQGTMAQRIATDGSLVGDAILVAAPAAKIVFDHDVAYASSSDSYLVVWHTYDETLDIDLSATLVGSDGTIGSEIPVSTPAGTQSHGRLAYNRIDGEFLVIWNDARDGLPPPIYGQRITADGTLVGSEFVISSAPHDSSQPPDITFDEHKRQYLVVWQMLGTINAQRVKWNGALLGSPFLVSDTTDATRFPSVAYDRLTRTFRVVWSQNPPNEVRDDVYGQVVAPDASLVGGNYSISTAPEYQFAPSIEHGIADESQFLTVWCDNRNHATTGTDIYGDTLTGPTVLDVCGSGGVNAAAGTPEDVLLVNASSGGASRTVTVPAGEPIDIFMNVSSAGPNPGAFALYGWLGIPDGSTFTPHPKNIGDVCFPTPLRGGAPQPKKI